MADRDPLHISGQVVAEKYSIEQAVGAGGFSIVYRALHTIWKRPVAIKFFSELSNLPLEQRDQMQRAFINEGALLSELSSHSAAIVQARDVGTYTTPDGRWMPYMVLEWLEGRSLEQVLADEAAAGGSRWSLDEVMALLGPVARALDVAHGRGIAHRDIKPPNLFVIGDPRGREATVKILDFGVAKLITDNAQMTAALAQTGAGISSFTPQYGAPEQFSRAHGATGPWTDVFALALVAAELLAGKPGLEGDDVVQIALSSRNPRRRPTPRGLGAWVSDRVEAVFEHALAVDPGQRYARAADFWSALEEAASHPESSAVTLVPPGAAVAAATLVTGAESDPMTSSTASIADARPKPRAASSRRLSFSAMALGALAVVALLGGVWVNKDGVHARLGAALGPKASGVGRAVAAVPKCPSDTFEIPGGQFYMGSDDKAAPDNQKPSHNVSLDAFCMDAFEVTALAYEDCSNRGACRRLQPSVSYPGMTPAEEQAFLPLCNVGKKGREQHPMNCLGWADADVYCRRQGKRLPTEAEWEYATRGPDGRVFPWGDEPPTVAYLNACDADCAAWSKKAGVQALVLFEDASDGYSATAPVGKFEKGRSRFGPWDVAGNVWEWVADWNDAYGVSEQKNPKGPAGGERRGIRGGAWNGARVEWLHPSFRFAAEPDRHHPAIGFRCVKDI